jgi:predicted DNA-binding transcriptional regulator YafY
MASQKLQRWIDLLAALLRRRFPVSLEELRPEVPGYWNHFEKATLRRAFERDKAELRAFGIPIETVSDPNGEVIGYRLDPKNFYLPYLSLRSAERTTTKPKKIDQYGYRALIDLYLRPEDLDAIVDAAARVRQLGDPLLVEHVDSALRKLAVDLPIDRATPQPTIVPPRAKAPTDLLSKLGNAVERHKRVTFTYHAMTDGADSTRTVEPFGLFYLNQHWYLAARTAGEFTPKNYRVNRMKNLSVSDKEPIFYEYQIPEGFNIREHARSRQSWELGTGDTITATVKFTSTSGAAAAALRLGEPIAGHPQNRTFRVRRGDAFARWLLSFGGDLIPVSPRSLVDEFRGLVKQTLAHHSASPPPTRPGGTRPASPLP